MSKTKVRGPKVDDIKPTSSPWEMSTRGRRKIEKLFHIFTYLPPLHIQLISLSYEYIPHMNMTFYLLSDSKKKSLCK